MITFRRVTILFFILLFTINLVHFLGCRLAWFPPLICEHIYTYMLILFGLYISVSVTMAFFIRSGFHHASHCHGQTKEKICALTFDDSPDAMNTPLILSILNRERIWATFFVIGAKLTGNEALLKEINAAGHLIGNHSWNHSVWFDFFPAKKMQREISRTSLAVSEIIGKAPLLFRPPFGVVNPALHRAITRLGYHVIGWNVRSYDTVHRDPHKTIARILKRVTPGSIILLHDHLPESPEILEELVAGLKRNGYNVVPLNQLIPIEAYE